MSSPFKKLEYKDLLIIKPYLYSNKSKSCDFTVGVKFSWKDYFSTEFLLKDNTLYLSELYSKTRCYYLPLGKNIEDYKEIIEDYFKSSKLGTPLHFANLSNDEVLKLSTKFPHYEANYDRAWSDYIYLTEDFMFFAGNKYSSKRRQLNKFKRTYPNVRFLEAKEDENEAICQFIKNFVKTKELTSEESINEENEAIAVVNVYKDLGMKCFVLKDGENIIGVTILEIANDIIFDHIEKCLREYEGVYAFMINSIALTFKDIKYFNREDDSGDEGLRYSKMELRPIELINKYVYKVLNNVDLVDKNKELIIDGNIALSFLKKEQSEEYLKLSIDEDNNKYWGYDYKSDLNGNEASKEYFYNMVNSDFKKKEVFTLMINYKSILIGEILIYNLLNDNSGEVGIRLFKEYQNKGIAKKVLNTFIQYLFKDLKLNYIVMKAMKENIYSHKLIKSLNFKEFKEDETFLYYQLFNSIG